MVSITSSHVPYTYGILMPLFITGTFHLLHLMFDDYVLYVMENLHSTERANDLLRSIKGETLDCKCFGAFVQVYDDNLVTNYLKNTWDIGIHPHIVHFVFISVDPKDDIVLPNPHISDPQYTPSLNSGQQSVTPNMMTERQTVITDGREAYQMSNNGTKKDCKQILSSVELTPESDKEMFSSTLSPNTNEYLMFNVFPEGNWQSSRNSANCEICCAL